MQEIIDINTLFGPMPAGAADLSVTELEELMRTHNVRYSCTLSTVGMLLDPVAGNGATRAAVTAHSSLIPVATLNPLIYFGDPIASFRSEGFRVIRFFPAQQQWSPQSAAFSTLIKQIEQDCLPILVEVDERSTATVLAAALAQYPGPVILSGVSDLTLAEVVAVMRTCPRFYLETSSLLAMGAIGQAVTCVGADRVLFGSGAPLKSISGTLGTLKYAGLSDKEFAKVTYANAHKLLELS